MGSNSLASPPVVAAQAAEALAQLRPWVQSPAWAAYSTLVHKRVLSSEAEKASRLRASDLNGALLQQGRSDGLHEALRCLEQELSRLQDLVSMEGA